MGKATMKKVKSTSVFTTERFSFDVNLFRTNSSKGVMYRSKNTVPGPYCTVIRIYMHGLVWFGLVAEQHRYYRRVQSNTSKGINRDGTGTCIITI